MKRFITIALLTFVFSSIYADRFRVLNENNGLSSRRTYSVVQDKYGFMWISTKISVDRYDGHSVKSYSLNSPDESTDNIGFNFVTLAPDSSVWAYTQNGEIYQYNEISDNFEYITSIYQHFSSYSIILNYIYFENQNTLLLATAKGVLKFDNINKSFTNCKSLSDLSVYHINKENDLYYISTTTGLYIAHGSSFENLKIVKHLFNSQFVTKVFYDKKYQRFWVGTNSNGIYIISNRGNSEGVHILPALGKPVRSILVYNSSQIAVGIDGEGVYMVNRQSLTNEKILSKSEFNDNSISGNSVWNVFLDRQNILWIATFHEGVSYSDDSQLKFNKLIHEKGNVNSLSSNYINTVLEDKDGDLWFGTNNGISVFYRKNGTWKHLFREKNISNGNVILTLCESADGTIWAGGYAFGVAEINKSNLTFTRHVAEDKNPIIGTNQVYAIYQDRYSTDLWIGGIYGKVSRLNINTKKAVFYDTESIRCFESYNDSVVMLGLYRGVQLMNINTGVKKTTKVNSIVNCILKDNDKYWIGTTKNGLYLYDLKNDSIKRFTKSSHGLSSNHVYSIEKDENGKIWIGTENGLNKFDPKTEKIALFDKQDGLVSNQFSPNSSKRLSTSEIVFGTVDGALLFYPSEIDKINIKKLYTLIFTDFQLFGNTMSPGEKDSPLKATINNTKKIKLSHNRNYFSFTFTHPFYQLSDKVEYSYLLEGYDITWSQLSTSNKASYSKVQPGSYTFRVRSYVDSQQLAERSLIVTIKKPWWNSLLAWVIYFMIIGVATYFTLRYLSNLNLKRQTEERMNFFINTAHDILTPLNLIESPLKEISITDNTPKDIEYLTSLALDNTQKLRQFVKQLIDFQKITLQTDQLVVRKNNVNEFFISKTAAYKSLAAQKFISVQLSIPNEEKVILFDKEKIGKIIDNLLSNAVKYTPYGGKIDINVLFNENNWSFSIEDSGIGIPLKSQNLIFKHILRIENEINTKYVGSGVGLKMVYALVKIHQGEISFHSKQNEGTTFKINLPYNYDEKFIDSESLMTTIETYLSGNKSNPKLMIVSSDIELTKYLQNSLNKEFTIFAQKTGADAFSNILSVQPALIIADGFISDMTGVELCEKIKGNSETFHIPIILVVNQSDTDMIKSAFSSGANEYVEKPFEVEVLKMKIQNLINLQETWQNKALSEVYKNNISVVNNDRDQKFIDDLIELIEINIDNPDLNINLLCSELAMSRSLLYNKVTHLTGESPNEFIRNIRLKKAAKLLIDSKYSISEVSDMVGFSNPKYFSRIFKEYYHVSPKNYLK